MHKASTEGLWEAFRLARSILSLSREFAQLSGGTQMALLSLPVAGHLLLSAGIPSESTGVCFMQHGGNMITESFDGFFSM